MPVKIKVITTQTQLTLQVLTPFNLKKAFIINTVTLAEYTHYLTLH